LAIAIQVTGGDHRLPGGGPAVLPAAAERLAGFGVVPAGAGRFGEHGGVEADLLMGGGAEVVVGEDVPQAPVDVVGVDQRVGEPALQGGARAQPVAAAELAEIRVLPGHRAFRAAIAWIRLSALVVLADGVDALHHRGRREGAVLVVPAVGRAVGGGQVPLRQVDVLADDVGGRTHLVV